MWGTHSAPQFDDGTSPLANTLDSLLPPPPKPKPKPMFMELIRTLSQRKTDFVVTPCLPDDSAPAPDPPGPQYYWSLRTSDVTDVKREDDRLEDMRREGEEQKRNDELSCVAMLLGYVSTPGHLPHPSSLPQQTRPPSLSTLVLGILGNNVGTFHTASRSMMLCYHKIRDGRSVLLLPFCSRRGWASWRRGSLVSSTPCLDLCTSRVR